MLYDINLFLEQVCCLFMKMTGSFLILCLLFAARNIHNNFTSSTIWFITNLDYVTCVLEKTLPQWQIK